MKKKIEDIENQVQDEKNQHSELRAEVAAAVNQPITNEWETLLAGLERKRDEVVGDYKAITAEIIGKKCVYKALGEARDDEKRRT